MSVCCSTAVGCPDLELPANSAAHVVRSVDTADVICNDSTSSMTSRGVQQDSPEVTSEHRRRHGHYHQLQSWRLVCHGTQWIGDYDNCTRHQGVVSDDEQQQQQQQHVYSTEHVIHRDGNNTT